MSNSKVSYCNKVIERLKEVKNLPNLDAVADFLGIKPSTLRSRKSRGSIPYEEIVSNLSKEELGKVFKGSNMDIYDGSQPQANSNIVSEPIMKLLEESDLFKEDIIKILELDLSPENKAEMLKLYIHLKRKQS